MCIAAINCGVGKMDRNGRAAGVLDQIDAAATRLRALLEEKTL